MMKQYRCLGVLIACLLLTGLLAQSAAAVVARVDRRGAAFERFRMALDLPA